MEKLTERFCKYYVLETKNKKDLTELDRELKKRLLRGNYIRKIKDAKIENANLITYDSGEFDVLYSKEEEIKKRKLFNKVHGLELVVKATSEDFIDIQEYLKMSNIDVREARNVTRAIIYFYFYKSGEGIEILSELLENVARTNFKKIEGKFRFDKDQAYPSHLTGVYSGAVEEILKFRNTIIKISESDKTYIERNSVSFIN